MTTYDVTNESTPSTTWTTRITRVPTPPRGQRHVRAQARAASSVSRTAGGWRRFATLDNRRRRQGVQLVVVYRGGAEAWYEVRARGSAKRYPGYFAIHDIMRDVWNDV